MNGMIIFYFSSVLLTFLLTGFLAWYAWRTPPLPGVRTYAWISFGQCLLALTEIFSLLSSTQADALFWFKTRFFFTAVIPVIWLSFMLEYHGHKNWLSVRLITGMFIIPIITQIILWTNPLHELWVKQEVAFHQSGPFWIAITGVRVPGLWFMVHMFYSFALIVVAIGVILVTTWQKGKPYYGQAALLTIGALIALAGNLIPVFNLLPQIGFNTIIPSLGISSLLYALAVFHFDFLKRPPALEDTPGKAVLEDYEKRSLAVFILTFVLFIAGIAVVSYVTYQTYKAQFRAQMENQLSAIATLKVDELQDWRKERLADANLFYQNNNFSARVNTYFEDTGNAEAKTQLLEWIKKVKSSPEYDRISLLDTQGREQISIPTVPEIFPEEVLTNASTSLEKNEIIFLDFYRDSTPAHTHLSILVPIFDAQNQPLGILILQIDPDKYLYPFIQRWPIPNKSAETVLIRRDGNDVLYLNELKFSENAALNLRIPLENTNIPAIKAVLGMEGVTEGVDYRGTEVISNVRAVPNSPWFLAAKMDKSEAYAPLQARFWQTIIFFSLLVLTAGVALALIWRRQQMRNFRSQVKTLKALQASEEKFRLAFDTSPDAISITRLSDGMFVSVNKGFEQVSGYSREDIIGKTSLEFNIWKNPEDRQKVIKKLSTEGEVKNYEAAFLTRHGEIYGLMSASILELNGEPHVLNITRDITERKKTEEQVRKLHRAVEQSTTSVVITDSEGNVEYVNPRFSEITGYSLEETLEKNPRILKSEYTSDEEYQKLWETITSGGIWQGEFLNKKKDGTTFWESATIAPVFDENGKITNFLAVKEDITTRKQAEENYRSIFDNALEGIFQSLPQGQFIKVNPAFARMLGYASPDELVETVTDIASQTYVDPQKRQEFMRIMEEQGAITGFEFQMKRKDGGIIWVAESTRTVRDHEGKILYYEGTSEDITARKDAEQKLIQRTQQLHLLNEATHRLNLSLQARHVYEVIYSSITQLMPCDTLFISSFDPVSQMITLASGWHDGNPVNVSQYEPIPLEPEGSGTQSQSIRTKESQLIPDFQTRLKKTQVVHHIDENHNPVDIPPEDGDIPRSALIVPMTAEGEVVGVVQVFSYKENIFTEEDLQILNGFCSQAAIALSNAHLYEKIQQENLERQRAEQGLRSAQEFLQSVQDALSAHISILDKEGNIFQVNSAWKNFGIQNGLKIPNHCIGINYLDVCNSATGVYSEEAGMAAAAIRDVISGRKNESVFEYPCHSPHEERWFIARITRFQNNGQNWAVVSHENITSRKHAEEGIRQRMTELEVLHENSLSLNQSLNPKEIAQKVINLLREKMNWHHTAIRLFDEQSNSLELVAFDQQGLGNEEEETKVKAHLSKLITRIGEGLSGWALQRSQTLRIGDVTNDPRYVESYPGIHSGLYAPMKSGDHSIGIISIESEKPNAFSEADEQLITTLANQAAIALENAHLYKRVSRHAEELEQRVQERTAEIESTRRRLELAVSTAGIGIWELDIRKNEEYWDDRLFNLYGISKETSLPEPQTWYKVVHPDDLKKQLKVLDEALHDQRPYNTEFRVIWPDASIHHIKSTGSVIYDSTGKAERIIGANQDITLHKQSEEILHLANAEIKRALRMKTEFLATMSHELRTPLNSILGISESLEEQIAGPLNEKQIKYIRIIIESGHHLLELINDILDLSKVEAGKLELNTQTIPVEKLCTSSLGMIKELAQKKSLKVSLKMDEKVRFVLGDERRLKQSLVNLLSNAVKFTPQGREIGLEVKGSAETHELMFIVWDTGIGIDVEDKDRLFQPFVQLKAGLAREYAGTGLGLALVAQMVRLHGGHITLDSQLNMGSRFTITLPWLTNEQNIPPPPASKSPIEQPTAKGKHAGKILIVDDTEVVSQLISDYLQHKGYETFVAANGREGVLLAKEEHPQIILMDVMMPEMNGFESTQEIRADASLRDVPIIGLTALAMSTDRDQCLAAGMNDHLSKPIQMQELVRIIEYHLRQNG
jgi:PAS domain S-box-containing protein